MVAVSHDSGSTWQPVALKVCGKDGMDPGDRILAVSAADPEVFYVWAPSCPGSPLFRQRSDATTSQSLPLPEVSSRRAIFLPMEPVMLVLDPPAQPGAAPEVRAIPCHFSASWAAASAAVKQSFLDGVFVYENMQNDPVRPDVVHADGHMSFIFPP